MSPRAAASILSAFPLFSGNSSAQPVTLSRPPSRRRGHLRGALPRARRPRRPRRRGSGHGRGRRTPRFPLSASWTGLRPRGLGRPAFAARLTPSGLALARCRNLRALAAALRRPTQAQARPRPFLRLIRGATPQPPPQLRPPAYFLEGGDTWPGRPGSSKQRACPRAWPLSPSEKMRERYTRAASAPRHFGFDFYATFSLHWWQCGAAQRDASRTGCCPPSGVSRTRACDTARPRLAAPRTAPTAALVALAGA